MALQNQQPPSHRNLAPKASINEDLGRESSGKTGGDFVNTGFGQLKDCQTQKSMVEDLEIVLERQVADTVEVSNHADRHYKAQDLSHEYRSKFISPSPTTQKIKLIMNRISANSFENYKD